MFKLPAEDDGLIGSFSSVMYPGGGVSVIGKVALSGTADANSSRLGSSGCSMGICIVKPRSFVNTMYQLRYLT